MKYLIAFLIASTLLSFCFVDDFYKIELKTIDGQKISLSDFKGKKILFVTLPVIEGDTSLSVSNLISLETKFYSSLVVIGIPAEDLGSNTLDKIKIKKMYKDQKPNFIMTETMKVKKTSGELQSALFQWLTNKDKNRHFDQDITGTGIKFFVDEKGELYAVLGPKTSLSNPVIEKVLSKPVK